MKSIIDEMPIEQEIKAPCLLKVTGEPKEKEYVIFVTELTRDYYTGSVIWAAKSANYKVGDSSTQWIKVYFELFAGTISLSN